ncbi:hypothetical protein GGP93_003287 [Salinibacter ruber]|nr:hypothetical protein [Salinibacter ruber]
MRRDRTYELVVANAEKAFPNRAGYKQWIRRLKRLLGQVGRLAWAAALRGLAGEGRKLYAADSLPIPCRFRCVRWPATDEPATDEPATDEPACWIRTARSSG